MTRRFVLVVLAAALAVLLVATPSFADYKDTGFDPNDSSGDLDVQATTRRVWLGPTGTRWFAISIRMYDQIGREQDVRILLDSRRGPRKDGRLSISKVEGPAVCDLSLFDFEEGWIEEARVVGRRMRCQFEFRHLHADKHVRWRMLSPAPSIYETFPIDRAPDHRWYE
jgi:hypothetical protein